MLQKPLYLLSLVSQVLSFKIQAQHRLETLSAEESFAQDLAVDDYGLNRCYTLPRGTPTSHWAPDVDTSGMLNDLVYLRVKRNFFEIGKNIRHLAQYGGHDDELANLQGLFLYGNPPARDAPCSNTPLGHLQLPTDPELPYNDYAEKWLFQSEFEAGRDMWYFKPLYNTPADFNIGFLKTQEVNNVEVASEDMETMPVDAPLEGKGHQNRLDAFFGWERDDESLSSSLFDLPSPEKQFKINRWVDNEAIRKATTWDGRDPLDVIKGPKLTYTFGQYNSIPKQVNEHVNGGKQTIPKDEDGNDKPYDIGGLREFSYEKPVMKETGETRKGVNKGSMMFDDDANYAQNNENGNAAQRVR